LDLKRDPKTGRNKKEGREEEVRIGERRRERKGQGSIPALLFLTSSLGVNECLLVQAADIHIKM